jgi:predicted ATPase
MEGKRLIEKIKLRNILSFGDKGEEIELQPLNIIIGQNASGKSNLVDVIKLLRSLPQEKGLSTFISRNGGINEWIWKGNIKEKLAEIEVDFVETDAVYYKLIFEETSQQRLKTTHEQVKNKSLRETIDGSGYHSSDSFLSFNFPDLIETKKFSAYLQSRKTFSSIVFYTDLLTNRSAEIRKPQFPDAPNDFLEEDGSNLALVLNDLEHRGDTKDKIIENLKKFNPRIKDYSVRILGGTVQLFIREEGLEKPISAMRLSDGTLRYLCLLAILCHPEPPPLICIEEPETGLHPDILPTIAELMIEASKRTQLIVTTHSDILVSAFSERPEAVLVCEKDEDGTHFKRLEADKLKVWLDEYSLGETWLRGGIGGTRW